MSALPNDPDMTVPDCFENHERLASLVELLETMADTADLLREHIAGFGMALATDKPIDSAVLNASRDSITLLGCVDMLAPMLYELARVTR